MNRVFAKKIIASGLLALSMALIACSTSDDGPSITTQPSDQTVLAGGTVTLTVVASGSGLSYQWSQNGSAISGSGATSATLSLPSAVYEDSGSYTCTVTNSSGSVTTSAAFVHVQTTWPSSQTVTAGAQGNSTYGTAIDLDGPTVMKSAVANQNESLIDLLFVYDTQSGDFELMSPYEAYEEDISVAANYTPSLVADTKFVKVSSKPVSQEAGAAAYVSGTKVDVSAVEPGDQFIVKTTDGAYVYVLVSDLEGADQTDGQTTLTLNISDI